MVSAVVPYRLVDMDSQEILLLAEDVRGFFIGADEEPPRTVVFVGARHIRQGKKKTESTQLEIVDRGMGKIGAYYIGKVARGAQGLRGGGGGYSDVEYSFHGNACEYPKAGEIWRKWSDSKQVSLGGWAEYPSEYHASWLHVVQTAWFSCGLRATRYQTAETAGIEGRELATEDAFYCAVGEAVNGPGGYFGSNLDALYDCLRTMKREEAHPFCLEWGDFSFSREVLGGEFTSSALSIFQEFGVQVNLAGD
ncbi:barstar family protein [Streptomyces zingiberis]|uniref:Barnase inhibitor n=1 Tax=Streptomyces zingiberis TaxID=2053010 RepID=A0ABX1BU79_9ACTN|nr:barstar family protein [Streptomyces zingiberis]NJP99980.1 barnase inhibitor [Streptomyces zingiberis]